MILAIALLVVSTAWAAPPQGRRVVDLVTMGDARSEREHEYAGERVTEGVVDGRVFRQAAAWLRVSLAVYEDTEVTLVGMFRGNAGDPIAFELLVEGRKVPAPAFVSPSTSPARVEFPVPMTLTQGKTRISVVFRAVGGPTPGLIELRTVQEHLERRPSIQASGAQSPHSACGGERAFSAACPGERAQPSLRTDALR
jgi:hypothetical protein